MCWFNKRHPNAIYVDNNPRPRGCSRLQPSFECKPDLVMDFKALDFEDGSFRLVVWDPPHVRRLGRTSELRKKYGSLDPASWQDDLRRGFAECWRVLRSYGILIFKWSEEDVPLPRVLELFPQVPLFGHTTGSKSRTKWLCFMKIPHSRAAARRGNKGIEVKG